MRPSRVGPRCREEDVLQAIRIEGCAPVPIQSHPDHRGALLELHREQWPGAFPTVQWNACISKAGVMRGVHVHVNYAEFYTLVIGRLFVALKDIRRDSPTFLESVGFEWSATDMFAVPVPPGVAHAVYAIDDSVLALGMSDYWSDELDLVGCRWDVGCQWDAAMKRENYRRIGAISGLVENLLVSQSTEACRGRPYIQ